MTAVFMIDFLKCSFIDKLNNVISLQYVHKNLYTKQFSSQQKRVVMLKEKVFQLSFFHPECLPRVSLMYFASLLRKFYFKALLVQDLIHFKIVQLSLRKSKLRISAFSFGVGFVVCVLSKRRVS